MSTAPTLTMIAPDLRAMPRDSQWRHLEWMAGRGQVRRLQCNAQDLALWQRAVLEALRLGEEAARYPSAALTRAGSQAALPEGNWWHAELVHFAASLDSIAMVPLHDDDEPTLQEREALLAIIAEHLRGSGMQLHADVSGHWLMSAQRPVDVATVSPQTASRRPLEESMPRGADSGALRRLMTEWQMLLHEHPVNLRRARRERLQANALWLWGGGAFRAARPKMALPRIYSERLYLRGLCLAHSHVCEPLPADAQALLRGLRDAPAALIVVESRDIAAFQTQWLAPLLQATVSGELRGLEVMLDGWHLSVDPSARWKFWRRPLPVERWSA